MVLFLQVKRQLLYHQAKTVNNQKNDGYYRGLWNQEQEKVWNFIHRFAIEAGIIIPAKSLQQ